MSSPRPDTSPDGGGDGGAPGGMMLAEAGLAVDLGLVLAVDCSSSVDAGDFQIQMQGIAAGAHRRIVMSLVLWSNAQTQAIAMPWRLLANDADLEIAAREIETTGRKVPPGGTGLAAAIDYSAALLSLLPVPADRLAIDVSGDGEDNEGGNAGAARDRAVARGITVNGLPIIDGSSSIAKYYHDEVIGGPGSFIEQAETIMSFRDTILRKLLREIGRPVS